MAEDYVRPPILAVEPRSRRAAVWRFRIVLGLILLALAAGIVLVIRAITSSNDNGGAVGIARPTTVTTGQVAAAGR